MMKPLNTKKKIDSGVTKIKNSPKWYLSLPELITNHMAAVQQSHEQSGDAAPHLNADELSASPQQCGIFDSEISCEQR